MLFYWLICYFCASNPTDYFKQQQTNVQYLMKQPIKTTEAIFPMPVLLVALKAIAFDPYTHGYYLVSQRVGEAFKDGMKLK